MAIVSYYVERVVQVVAVQPATVCPGHLLRRSGCQGGLAPRRPPAGESTAVLPRWGPMGRLIAMGSRARFPRDNALLPW
jgi:hypothetical protein